MKKVKYIKMNEMPNQLQHAVDTIADCVSGEGFDCRKHIVGWYEDSFQGEAYYCAECDKLYDSFILIHQRTGYIDTGDCFFNWLRHKIKNNWKD